MKTIIAALFLALAFAGCASTAPQTPAQAVYAVESAFTAAMDVALVYKALPPCTGAKMACSDSLIVAKLAGSAQVAYDALIAAQTAVQHGISSQSAIDAANQAVKALTDLIAVLPKTGT